VGGTRARQRQRRGCVPRPAHPSARRLDAFARLARHALAYDPDLSGDKGGRRPVLTFACDYNTLTRQLTNGVLDPG